MNIKSFKYVLTAVLVILLASCKNKEEAKKDKNYAGLVDIKVERFDQDLFSISPYGIKDSIGYLENKYPDFFPLYTNKIIEIGGPESEWFLEGMVGFITDFTIHRVQKRIGEVFSDMSEVEKGLSLGFSNLKGYLPETRIPRIITCNSGFNLSMVTTGNILAIGLDRYLGADEEFYDLITPPIPQYERRVMRPEKIAPDALFAWMKAEIPMGKNQIDLISNMVYEGKIMYCVKRFMPGISDTLLWGFTKDQMSFCRTNEHAMWEYLKTDKRLFKSEPFMITQFIEMAPFTRQFGEDSPGRAAVWTGYRIVESYMKNNPKVTVQELMQQDQYQNIFALSKYNP